MSAANTAMTNQELAKRLAEKIKELRKGKYKTQIECIENTSLKISTLKNAERGKELLNENAYNRIFKELGVKTEMQTILFADNEIFIFSK